MNPAIQYPTTRRGDCLEVLHGTPVADPYRWLEDDNSSETAAWVAAQNEVTFGYLNQVAEREELRARLTELWDYEKFGVPIRRGSRIFYTRNDGLQNQSALYWQEGLEGSPRLLLDPNTLSADGTVALSGFEISDDGRYLAYGLSGAGSDWQEWFVREVDSGADLPDRVQWVKFSSAAWTAGSQGFFYSRYDAPAEGEALKGANYYQKLYYHRLGEDQSADRLVYQRPDQKEWGFSGVVSDDGAYLVIHVWHGTHEENAIFYQALNEPGAEVVELFSEFDASYEYLGNEGTLFYFLTGQDAPQYRVIAVDIRQPDREHWVEVIAEHSDTLQFARMVGRWLVAAYLHHAHSRLVVYDLRGQLVRSIELPGHGTVAGLSGGRKDDDTFFLYTSFTNPGAIYRHHLPTGESSLFRQPGLRFDPAAFVTEQVFYPSKDGTQIPMFISYRRGLERNGENRTYLYGYGGFNISLTPTFHPAGIVWMEMGGIYVYTNLRGGGEYGKAWHEAGMKHNKQNVFDDFIAAAEWLVREGYTRPGRLAIHGRSNGGLLTGACLTQRPELYGAVIVGVGVLDMLRFHKFTIGWGWVSDYGSPDDPDDFKALLAYSPYHNVRPGTHYPPTLVTTGDHDDRVFPAHSFKFAAALQAAQAGPAPVLIRIDVRAGHGAGKPTAKLIDEWADMFAFLVQSLGSEQG